MWPEAVRQSCSMNAVKNEDIYYGHRQAVKYMAGHSTSDIAFPLKHGEESICLAQMMLQGAGQLSSMHELPIERRPERQSPEPGLSSYRNWRMLLPHKDNMYFFFETSTYSVLAVAGMRDGHSPSQHIHRGEDVQKEHKQS